ncbi:MAG: hypothetical protein II198_01760, partial [Bacteroidaceae bacterium]|nr:hypothetical protein [Bacteroidaceae bacterium]
IMHDKNDTIIYIGKAKSLTKRVHQYFQASHNEGLKKKQMVENITKGIEETIIDLFEEMSNKYHYFDETSKNIHYFNGWKTKIQGVEVACFFIVVVLHLFVFLWGFVPLNVISCRSALRE